MIATADGPDAADLRHGHGIDGFGVLPDGRAVSRVTLKNGRGMTAEVSDYGATLLRLDVPDRNGQLADVTLGFQSFDGWLANEPYFGATIGRFGNRIRDGRFCLDGRGYQLATNNEPDGIPCHLHGGVHGFSKALWKIADRSSNAVKLTHVSPAGDEGYPGTLAVEVVYELTEDNELIWTATATTDAPTIVNLVHHTYWNLTGEPGATAMDHELMLDAQSFLMKGPGMIPTGEISAVSGTPMDFNTPQRVGERIDTNFPQLRMSAGYDHCWVLQSSAASPETKLAAVLHDPVSGRIMKLRTNQPGIQFYSANHMEHEHPGKNGVRYQRRSGLCLETQAFPDSPNQPNFPSSVLRPGERYRHVMVHQFSTY